MVKTEDIRACCESTCGNSKARVVACLSIRGVDSRRQVPPERPILQVCDQVVGGVCCDDWTVGGNDFCGAVDHVGRLVKTDLRNDKRRVRGGRLVEEKVST